MSEWQVIQGDCLDVLPTLPDASVDAVVTDPPYGINTKSDGSGKLNPWADLCNASLWYATWLGECRRIIRPTGCLWTCLNWRSLATFQKAACDLRWPIESLLVWDKEWIGPGGSRGLRPSYELVALFAGDSFSIEDRGLSDVQRFKWCGHKPTGHPAEKPVDLGRWLIRAAGASSVLDPFCGSGSFGIAARREGASFLGIELDAAWSEESRMRLAREAAQPLLIGAGP